jgi:hypothetical protein
MAKLLVNKETNVVVYIGEAAEMTETGIDVGGVIFAEKDLLSIVEVDEVPPGVKVQEYCYEETRGFYKNPMYVPIIPIEQRIAQLEEQLRITQEAVDALLLG